MIWTVFLAVILIAIVLNFSTWVGCWHRHDWYKHLEVESPSIYSDNKVNVNVAYRCRRYRCRAMKMKTHTK